MVVFWRGAGFGGGGATGGGGFRPNRRPIKDISMVNGSGEQLGERWAPDDKMSARAGQS
jgi:hypothetical protein